MNQMRRLVWVALALLSAPMTAIATDTPATAPSAEQELAQITAEYNQALAEFSNVYQQAENDTERQAIGNRYPQPAKFLPRLMKIARQNPGKPVARDALIWVIEHGSDDSAEALTALTKDFAADPDVAQRVVPRLQWAASDQAEQLMRAVIEKTARVEDRDEAMVSLASFLKHKSEHVGSSESPAILAQAKELLEKVMPRRKDAKAILFEIEHLSIGRTAPEITGQNIDGKPMKLSDFAGKVVVLDFFGDW